MRLANNAEIRVFAKEGEDVQEITGKLKVLLGFDPEKEKVELRDRAAEGFEERKIHIISAYFDKERQLSAFLSGLSEKLGNEKETLLEQVDSRTDDNLDFFIRLDKEMLLKGKYVLTDSGNCYHIKISLAAFPKKKEKAEGIVKKILNVNK